MPRYTGIKEVIRLERSHREGQTILLHDNAMTHVAQVVKAILEEFEWKIFDNKGYVWETTRKRLSTFHHHPQTLAHLIHELQIALDEMLEEYFRNLFSYRVAKLF